MTWLCPRPCNNKTADGYCGTSWCINPMYSNIGTANEKLMGGLRKTTNADRIRKWSDEEIAEFTIEVADRVFELFTGAKMPDETRREMKTEWLDWLKQEASE